jgi:hypothetical protein
MLMGIMQQEEITLGCFVKVISVHPIITAAHVHNRKKAWRSAVTLSRKTHRDFVTCPLCLGGLCKSLLSLYVEGVASGIRSSASASFQNGLQSYNELVKSAQFSLGWFIVIAPGISTSFHEVYTFFRISHINHDVFTFLFNLMCPKTIRILILILSPYDFCLLAILSVLFPLIPICLKPHGMLAHYFRVLF